MELTGTIKDVSLDWKSGKYNLTLSVNERPGEEINDLLQCEKLAVTVAKFRQKRSLDSNAYAWVLMQKIAEAAKSDKWSVYLECLKKYSRRFTHIIVKPAAVEDFKKMYRECIDLGEITVNGMTGHQLQVYFGSSTFDSKDMSVFLEGVVSEAKELGIETLPPAELERMMNAWQRS